MTPLSGLPRALAGLAVLQVLHLPDELRTDPDAALPGRAPYWGDGSADALQWAGVLAIWACCGAVVTLARRAAPVGAAVAPVR